jgi:O-antigen ligase
MHSKRGHKMIIFVTCFFVFAATQVAARRFSQRGIEFTNFLETDGSLTRVINREQVWSMILTSTAWDKGAIIGQGWPYPYEIFATWPHNTFLGFWVAGGLPLLLVSLVFFGKSLQLIVSRFKSRDAVMGIFALMLILGSITIDLYRTSSMIFLTFTIFSLLYWETQKQPLQ